MLRLRICASILSMFSLAVSFLAWREASAQIVIALLAAAGCLAIVSPFDAPDPSKRRRVLFACLAYVAVLFTAAASAYASTTSGTLMSALLLLALLGMGLTGWAFATRNRRRLTGLQGYYQN